MKQTLLVGIVSTLGRLRRGMNCGEVHALQIALRTAGHQLVADGDFGPITEMAVERFQAAHGLKPDGVVGPLTAAALDAACDVAAPPIEPDLPSVKTVAPWLSIARALTGTKEIAGARSNPLIIKWAADIAATYPDLKGTVGWYSDDATPWCGLFAAYCMTRGGYKPPAAPLGAKNWFTDWRDGMHLDEPVLGAVLVKSRVGGGHVTFYEGEDATHYFCRGGNQSDQVNVSRIAKNADVLGFMWPKAAPIVAHGRVITSFAGAVAGSEA